MNKITKLLSVFVIAGAIGTGVAGVAGCNNGNSGNGGGGGHTHHYSYTDNEDGKTHKAECKDTDCDNSADKVVLKQDHVDKDGDNYCDLCDGKLVDPGKVTSVNITSATTIKIGTTVELTAEVKPDTATDKTVTWEITAGGDYAEIVEESGKKVLKLKDGVVGSEEITVKATAGGVSDTEIFTVVGKTKFDIMSESADNIISEDFENMTTVGDFSGTYGGAKGVYAIKKVNTATVTIVGGQAVQNAGTATGEVQTIVDFGETKEVIEGYFEVVPEGGNSWSPVRLIGNDGRFETDGTTPKIDEVFGLRTNSGKFNYRFGGGKNTLGPGAEFSDNGVAPADAVSTGSKRVVKIYFKYVSLSKTLSVTVDDVVYLNNYVTSINSVKGICLASSSDGSKKIAVDNIAINTYDVTKEDLKVAVDAHVTAVTADSGDLTLTGEGVAAAVTSAKEKIEAAADIAAAKTCYTEELAKIDAAILLQGKTSAKAFIDAMRTDTSKETFTGDAATEMENVKKGQKDILEAATDLADLKAKFATAKEAVNAVQNDADRLKAEITLVIKDVDGNELSDPSNRTKKLSGDKITEADLKELYSLSDSTKKVTGYYLTNTDKVLSDQITFDATTGTYTLTSDANIELVIYVKIEDKVEKTFKLLPTDLPTETYTEDMVVGADKFFTSLSTSTDGKKCVRNMADPFGRTEKKTVENEDGTTSEVDVVIRVIALTGGGASKTQNAIKFTVESECTVSVSGIIKEYTKEGDAPARTLRVRDFDKDTDATVTELKKDGVAATAFETMPRVGGEGVTADSIVTYTFKLAAGTYYLGANGDGMWIFDLSVTCLA